MPTRKVGGNRTLFTPKGVATMVPEVAQSEEKHVAPRLGHCGRQYPLKQCTNLVQSFKFVMLSLPDAQSSLADGITKHLKFLGFADCSTELVSRNGTYFWVSSRRVYFVLRPFISVVFVMYDSCLPTLRNMSFVPQNCTRLGEAGGCLLVTGGMNAFPDDRNLQHVGCAAVANLAMGNELNARRLVKARARIAVQRAMDTFMGVR